MKWTTVILSICFFGAFMACNDDPKMAAGEPASEVPAEVGEVLSDSARVSLIDDYMHEISLKIKQLDRKKYSLNIIGPKDAAMVVREGNTIVRAGATLRSDAYETRSVYYLKDGKLVHVDHRIWNKLDNPYAIQYIAYFNENEKIFQVGKREIKLESGEKPANVVGEPMLDDMVQADSLAQAFKADWERLAKAVDEQTPK